MPRYIVAFGFLALLVTEPVTAMTSDIEKYLKVKQVSAVMQSRTDSALLEQCLTRYFLKNTGIAPLVYKANGKTTVAIAQVWVLGAATYDASEPGPRIEVRGVQGRMATRQCADEVAR